MFRILRNNVLCSIATVRGNRAHINTAYFAYSPALELYFLSAPDSVHCRNLEANPSMAMTVFSSAQTWGKPDRGIQLFGVARKARGREAEVARRWYAKRFRAYALTVTGTSEANRRQTRQLQSYRFYRFVPTKVKVLDEREFGDGVFVVAAIPRRRRGWSMS